ncbi:MAG: hypothetical protein HW380_240 [Magnetococcales bacterium]|nr:hypothetical protein [Magnetococcales bacterium]
MNPDRTVKSDLFDQVGQQGNVSCPFDGLAQVALVGRTNSSDPAGDHFSPFGDETEQKLGIFVVDFDGLVGAEHADLPSPEERTSEPDGASRLGFVCVVVAIPIIFMFRHVCIHLFSGKTWL